MGGIIVPFLYLSIVEEIPEEPEDSAAEMRYVNPRLVLTGFGTPAAVQSPLPQQNWTMKVSRMASFAQAEF